MNRPLTPTEKCSLIDPQRTFDYYNCLNPKLENPSTIGFEIPKQNLGMYVGIGFGAMLIFGLVYFYATQKK